uniref:U1764af n=1 Tax=Mycobacterium leprae TaxID=1769 RepID=Q50016_MYCLR|nr:u1764af [Mycobacterium leprae]
MQQRKKLAPVTVQRGSELGNDLIDRALPDRGLRGHLGDLPTQISFMIR